MSVDSSSRFTLPKWAGPLIFVAAVGVVFGLSNHSSFTKTPEGLFVIADDDAYNKSIERAQTLSATALQHYHDGLQLTPAEITAVRETAQLVDQARLYKPNMIGPYFLGGMAHAAVGDLEKADEELRQGMINAKDSTEKAVILAAIDAHYERSRVLFQMGRYKEAYDEGTIAATSVPNAPDYLVARAKAAVQLGLNDVARRELSAAIALDPKNAGAKVLLKFLGSAPKQPAK